MSLSTRFIVLLLIAVCPAITVQLYNHWRLHEEREQDLRQTAAAQADMLGDELQRIVVGVEQLLVAAANSPTVRASGPACDDYMRRLQQAFDFVSNVGVADENGVVQCLNEPFDRGKVNISDRHHFRQARDTGRFAVGELFVGRVTGRAVIGFAQPIMDAATRQFRGVVYGSIKLSWLAEQFARKPLLPGSIMLVVDRFGRLVVSLPETGRAGETIPSEWNTLLQAESSGVVEKGPDRHFCTRDQVVAYQPLKGTPDGLALVVGLDRAYALRAIEVAQIRSLVVAGIALFGGLLLTLVLVHFMLRKPVAAILRVTRSVEAGNLDARTGVRRGKDEIAQIASAIDHLLDQLTRRISQQQTAEDALRVARDEALRVSAAKTDFLASASHDLRQPLQTLGLMAQVLTLRHPEGQDAKSAEMIGRAVRHMGSMVDTLGDIAQLDSGRVLPKPQPTQVAPILTSIRDEFDPLCREKSISLSVTHEDSVVWSDPALLSRILRNLVSNAVKFTPPGGHIDVTSERTENGVEIAVRDNGVGIPADKHREIFEEFRQLNNPERNRSKGIGLGLAIVDRLCRLLNHPVKVESSLGKGACFSIFAPVSEGRVAEQPSLEISMRVQGDILIVEDDPLVADATRQLLQTCGATVTVSVSAEDARAQLDGGRFAAIICDYRLPASSGVEVLRYAREKHPEIIAALVTGDVSVQLDDVLRADNVPILRKPVTVAQLKDVLRPLEVPVKDDVV